MQFYKLLWYCKSILKFDRYCKKMWISKSHTFWCKNRMSMVYASFESSVIILSFHKCTVLVWVNKCCLKEFSQNGLNHSNMRCSQTGWSTSVDFGGFRKFCMFTPRLARVHDLACTNQSFKCRNFDLSLEKNLFMCELIIHFEC